MGESPHLRGRLEDFERRLERLENELEELVWLAAGFDGKTGEPGAGPEPHGSSEQRKPETNL
jgi:hypothetical protein